MIATESCWERGCACHDSRESPGVELVKKREWVGLTDEEVVEVLGNLRESIAGNVFLAFARAIEAKLKEKNT